jgi:hypothetical protein
MAIRGQFNSSLTRVRPFFRTLLARDASGESWLPTLLGGAPRAAAIPDDVRRRPGPLRPELALTRAYRDRVLGRTIRLAGCFEHSAPPSYAFLRWLIEHPDRLHWPERSPVWGTKISVRPGNRPISPARTEFWHPTRLVGTRPHSQQRSSTFESGSFRQVRASVR